MSPADLWGGAEGSGGQEEQCPALGWEPSWGSGEALEGPV